MAVKNNDSVILDYALTNTTDSELVSSGSTWGVRLGMGAMLPGFESGIIGMEIDETKTITLTAANAWGEPDPSKIRFCPSIEHAILSGDTNNYPIGSVIPGGNAIIVGITGDTGTLDFNPPLAGKNLSLEVTLKKIEPSPASLNI